MKLRYGVPWGVALGVLASSTAVAEDLYDPTWSPGVSVYERPRPPFEARGHQVGDVVLYPAVDVAEVYNSNIFADDTPEVDDFITVVEPELVARLRQDGLTVDGLLRAQGNLYLENSEQSEFEYEGRVGAGYRLTSNDEISGSLATLRQVVSRADVEEGGGTGDPRVVYRIVGEAGYEASRGRLLFGADGRIRYDDFEQAVQRDKDRTVYDAEGFLGYQLTPALTPYIEPYYEHLDFVTSVDSNGFARDATVAGSRIGAEYEMGNLFTLQGAVGAGHWDFDDARFDNEWVWSAEAAVGWNVIPTTTLKLGAAREEVATTLNGSNLKEVREVRVGVEHAFRPNILGFADIEYRDVQFNNIGREDDDLALALGGHYLIDRMFSVSAGYIYTQRDSNRNADFDRNQAWLGLRAQF